VELSLTKRVHLSDASRGGEQDHMSEDWAVLGFLIGVACWTFVVLPLVYYIR